MRKVSLLLAFIFLLAMTPGHAQAQVSGKSAQAPVTSQTIDELSERLTAEQKELLVQLLEMLAAGGGEQALAAQQDKSIYDSMQQSWQAYRNFLWARISGFPEGVAGSAKALYLTVAGRDFGGNVAFLLAIGVTLILAFAAEYVVTRFVRSSRESGTHEGASSYEEAESLQEQLSILGRALGRDLAGLVAFGVVALVIVRILFVDENDHYLASSFFLFAVLIARFASALLRFVLAPFEPKFRMVTTDDWTSKFIYYHLVGTAAVAGACLFVIAAMDLFSVGGTEPFTFWAGLFLYLMVIYVTWRARNGLTSILKGKDDRISPGLERMAVWWPPFSIGLIIFQYLSGQIARATNALDITPGGAVSVLAIIVIAPFLDTMMRGLVRHLVPPMKGEGPVAETAYLNTRHSYVRIGRIVLFAILILVIGRLLGINLRSFAAAGLGTQIAAKGVGLLMILAVGYLIWELVNLLVNRRLVTDISEEASETGQEQGEGYGAGKSRMATVLPLIRMTLQVAVITITVLLVLSQLGINITPLLAGAGVLGLAIGFGAQTLVKDVVSGVFFLLDDAFRTGEYIDIGGTVGTVEKISVRSLQMRHPNGPVHIVPYGEIAKLTNHSRDYVIMKLKFTVPFDTDIDKVRKIFKKIGQEMMDNPALVDEFLQPFKSQGVAEVNDVGIVLRGKFMAKPGSQWVIRKEIYSRVQKAFEVNDIHFARREVRVQLDGIDDNDLNEREKKAVAAAAASAESKTG